MPATNSRRSRSRLGGRQLLLLSATGVIVLSLTFVLGVLVGRHWQGGPALQGQTEKGKRSALTGGVRERETERAGQLQGKLTFYQTLTAPLEAAPSEPAKPPARAPELSRTPGGGEASAAAKPSEERRAARSNEAPTAVGSETRAASPDGPAPPAPSPRPRWTIQVAAYRTRELAEELQKSLRGVGHDAYVTAVAFDDGRVHYRVRVGSFADRSEAERTADRLRSERSLVPFVTQK